MLNYCILKLLSINRNNFVSFQYSGLKSSLPKNVRILTIEPWLEGQFLLRLEHFIEKSDHEDLSKFATVNIEV